MELDTIIVSVLVAQAFINIGYLINLATRMARVETHLIHLMRAEGISIEG